MKCFEVSYCTYNVKSICNKFLESNLRIAIYSSNIGSFLFLDSMYLFNHVTRFFKFLAIVIDHVCFVCTCYNLKSCSLVKELSHLALFQPRIRFKVFIIFFEQIATFSQKRNLLDCKGDNLRFVFLPKRKFVLHFSSL